MEYSRNLQRTAIALLLGLTLGACSLPPRNDLAPSVTLPLEASIATPLGQAAHRQMKDHPGYSGIDPLADPLASFAVRIDLVRAAQRTLDVQYYIWRDDITGTLLLREIHSAAERGVRVRLLLDDNGLPSSLDETLAALARHPNIEVRLFNPFTIRHPKFIGFLFDFNRLNRRMHNKSLTADGIATIIGGRNIGDEYFGAKDGMVFADLDVLAIGPAARDVAMDFDRYWASESAYSVESIIAPSEPGTPLSLDAAKKAVIGNPDGREFYEALGKATDVTRLLDGSLPLLWAHTYLLSDDPAKGMGAAQEDGLIIAELEKKLGKTTRELDLISPYFVPGEAGTEFFRQLAASGVKVKILTNSLEATDVLPVHAGYEKRRTDLLKGGVSLFELRRAAGYTAYKYDKPGIFGSSGSSLHAKTFAVDGRKVFIGSLNFDPRSANLNTEHGFIIDSPELAMRIEQMFWELAPKLAYQVHLDDKGRLYWIRQTEDGALRYDKEPNSTWLQRATVYIFSILPIEWML